MRSGHKCIFISTGLFYPLVSTLFMKVVEKTDNCGPNEINSMKLTMPFGVYELCVLVSLSNWMMDFKNMKFLY